MRSSANTPQPTRDELAAAIETFLNRHDASPVAVEPVPGGANNRVFRVVDKQGRTLLLKCYFQHRSDPRDRFAAERAFYSLLWDHGIRQVPQPLGWDETLRLGLFEFIEGRKLGPAEIGLPQVSEALGFVIAINRLRPWAAGRDLPAASEACFSLASHLELVSRRIRRLQKMTPVSPADHQAAQFVADELEPSWQIIEQLVLDRCQKTGLNPDAPLSPSHRCLSPSDFGFHNALLPADGRLRFFDFEYAGWDDPAKLVCDFFLQPAIPVPLQYWDAFTSGLARALGQGEEWLVRARLLWPVCRLKWCCILLNEFVASGSRRRQFATGDNESRKHEQLAKARSALQALAGEQARPPASMAGPPP